MLYSGYEQLLVEKQQKVLIIKFNNARKKNCLNQPAYKEITRALESVNEDAEVTVVVFIGEGEYFSAGNDLSQRDNVTDIDAYLIEANRVLKALIYSFINCQKLIIALVNGPAIGIGCTLVALSDVAWCSEQAYFLTPFSSLGLVPEACSSYLFPIILGKSKANEMLVLNEKLTAQEAYQFSFVSRIFKSSELHSVVWAKIHQYSELPPNSLKECKRLIQLPLKEQLNRACEVECETLLKRFYDEEFMQAIVNFAMRKSKL
ncbi:CG13890 [Drosophila busckii]|uniref:CG13890 n=1 Tax=Drosophila busckii TaxID=30019 RepID=A0A0M4ENH0_DROBS|nr:enoyl-CoA delta isomerase 2, mitochondrial [Drosophila busckii]ALC43492.1 CG13890 [Drosophila busckii]